MKRERLVIIVLLVTSLLLSAAVSAHHVDLPPELQDALPALPDGSLPQPAGHAADLH